MTLDQAAARLRRAGLLATDAPADPRDAADLRLSIVGEPWPVIRSIVADDGFAEVGPDDGGGRLFAAYDPAADRWLRLHLRPVGASTGRGPRWSAAVPLPGMTVAILGPDGAGKSTLAAALGASFILPSRTFYAGMYPAGRRRFRQPGLTTAAILVRLWRLALEATWQRGRGRLVLFDRYAYDARLPMPRSAGRRSRFRRALLTRSLPTPDLVVVLDAPAAVLVARRAEHPIEAIETQRRRYLELAASLPDGVVLDATADADAVRRTLTGIVWARFVARRAGRRGVNRS